MLCKLKKGCLKGNIEKEDLVGVYLNVYDLSPVNAYSYWLGLGVYHSGVQVYDIEYAYGAHEYSASGIFEVEPKNCPGFSFRKSILIGTTDLSPKDVRSVMENLADDYTGDSYNLLTKNCNHFCKEACRELTGKPIPKWVNRLARLGLFCNCVLPAGLNDLKVQQIETEELTSHSDRYLSSSNPNGLYSFSSKSAGSYPESIRRL